MSGQLAQAAYRDYDALFTDAFGSVDEVKKAFCWKTWKEFPETLIYGAKEVKLKVQDYLVGLMYLVEMKLY